MSIFERLPIAPRSTARGVSEANMSSRGAFLVGCIWTMFTLGAIIGSVAPRGATEVAIAEGLGDGDGGGNEEGNDD